MKSLLVVIGTVLFFVIMILLAALYYGAIAYVILHFLKKFW